MFKKQQHSTRRTQEQQQQQQQQQSLKFLGHSVSTSWRVLSARASSPNSWWDFQSCDTSDSCPSQSPLSRPISSRHIIYMDLGRSLLPTKAPLQTKFEGSLVAFLRIWTAVLRTITSKTKEIIDLALVYSPLLILSFSCVYMHVCICMYLF